MRGTVAAPFLRGDKIIYGAIKLILELRLAFHQQPMHPDSRLISATYTIYGLYQWTVNVMSLTNPPQQFQAMIDWCLAPVTVCSSAYIDDILISTKKQGCNTHAQLLKRHYRDVQRVLGTLLEQQ